MNDSISIKQAVELLEQDGLLVGYDCPPQLLEHRFSHLSYSWAQGSTWRSRFMKGWTARTFWSATSARR